MRRAFRKVGQDEIEVRLPARLVDFVVSAAVALRRTAELPGTPGFDRVFGRPIDADAPGDPTVLLSRQLMVDDVTAVVEASAGKRRISLDEAEAWLKVLGMTLGRRAAELGVVTDADREALGEGDQATIAVLQTLQIAMVQAIDEPDGG